MKEFIITWYSFQYPYCWHCVIGFYILWATFWFVYAAWADKSKMTRNEDGDDVAALLATGFIGGALVVAALVLLWPLIIVIAILYIIFKVINKWGNKYREIVKYQEQKKLSALAELIKSDPTVEKAYKEIMRKSFPENSEK